MTGHLPEPPVMFASDLDRTLIYSANSMLLQGEDHEAPPMVVAEVYNGAPLSYMTHRAVSLLTAIAGAGVFVPVTTRTQAQFGRVQLPGQGQGYAVTTNGAVLLHDGEIDDTWRRQVQRSLLANCASLDEIMGRLTSLAAYKGIVRIHTAENVFVYAIVDRKALVEEELQDLSLWCSVKGWRTSLQGRKLYCVPYVVTKESAVAEIQRRTGAGYLMTAGDSILDAEMLRAGDLAFRPAHGELEDAQFSLENLTVTSSIGILAGEEILRTVQRALNSPSENYARCSHMPNAASQ